MDVAGGKWCEPLRSPLPTGSEEGPGSVVHGQRVDQLSGRGAQRPSLKQGERERGVVRCDVQLQGGVDADQQVDRLDGQFLQPHRVDQSLHRLKHLGEMN